MEKEVELRFKLTEDSKKGVKAKLENLGDFVGEFNQVDEYFYNPQEGRGKGSFVLRVRVSETETFLTYKKLVEDSWTEEETEIKDANSMKKIILAIGLFPLVKINKTRLKFNIGKFEVNLDEVKDLGTFVEIELVSTDIKLAKQQIMELANKLGLSEEIHVGYVPLILGE